jgi:hypothetical protein
MLRGGVVEIVKIGGRFLELSTTIYMNNLSLIIECTILRPYINRSELDIY